MDLNTSQTLVTPPPRLWASVALAAAIAALLLLLVVLPAEYGIDVTGFGKAVGLTRMATPPAKIVKLTDVVGGNEKIREVAVPDAGQPTPLPNPAVFQDEAAPPLTRTLQITIPAGKETEVKVKMHMSKVVAFSWQVGNNDKVYSDYHGHDPSFGAEFFVRYKEDQESNSGNGTLTAPFDGEHGWFWLNINDHPVTLLLTVTGYFDDLVDYGIH